MWYLIVLISDLCCLFDFISRKPVFGICDQEDSKWPEHRHYLPGILKIWMQHACFLTKEELIIVNLITSWEYLHICHVKKLPLGHDLPTSITTKWFRYFTRVYFHKFCVTNFVKIKPSWKILNLKEMSWLACVPPPPPPTSWVLVWMCSYWFNHFSFWCISHTYPYNKYWISHGVY